MATPQEWLDGLPRLAWLAGHGPCPHENQTFDSSLCWAGWMHTFCDDCDLILDERSECCQ